MKKEELEQRLQELSKTIGESAAHHQQLKAALENATNMHNALIGRYEEAQDLYNKIFKDEVPLVIPEVIDGSK